MRLTNICITCTAVLLMAVCSCQKVIQVHLNNTAAKNVIEGNVTDQPGPYYVKITRSVNFDEDNTFPAVSGAIVVITDNTAGLADTLKEITAGNYQTTAMSGVPGHNYQLYVKVGGQVFTASASMPPAVPLDSLYTEKGPFRSNINLVPEYTDPVTKGNYYHFTERVNDTERDGIFIRNDELVNGQVISQPLGGGGGVKLNPGDLATVRLECIDSAMYQYFYTLQQTKNQNSATPANPRSNIAGGALGYFSAHTLSVKSIVIQ